MGKNDLTSLSMRWRVDDDAAGEFRADLARHNLKVQELMESLMHSYLTLPTEMKSRLTDIIHTERTAAAGSWLTNRIGADTIGDDPQ